MHHSNFVMLATWVSNSLYITLFDLTYKENSALLLNITGLVFGFYTIMGYISMCCVSFAFAGFYVNTKAPALSPNSFPFLSFSPRGDASGKQTPIICNSLTSPARTFTAVSATYVTASTAKALSEQRLCVKPCKWQKKKKKEALDTTGGYGLSGQTEGEIRRTHPTGEASRRDGDVE